MAGLPAQLIMALTAAGRRAALLCHHMSKRSTARFAAPATVQAEREQATTTFCTLNGLKEVIAIHNLNLMGNSGKWN